jgi:hypothetical protein
MPDQYPVKSSIINFKAGQIICLDLDRLHLFAETIDTIEISDRCWVKPLAIARSSPESFELEFLHDLRDTAQLILPINLFRYALDTEVLPLTSQLFDPTKESIRWRSLSGGESPNPQRVLYEFITDLYRITG